MSAAVRGGFVWRVGLGLGGLLLILLIAGAGVGSLLMASEWAFNAVKIVGAPTLTLSDFSYQSLA